MATRTPIYEYRNVPPRRFPDGEIFLITAMIGMEKIEWGLPSDLLVDFRSQVESLSVEELFDPNIQTRLTSWLNEAVGFNLPVVRWRTAADYRYCGDPITITDKDPAVWNRDCRPNAGTISLDEENRANTVFNSQAYCAAVLHEERIVSMCFCGNDGTISIYTKPGSRRKGYAYACLRLLTKKCQEAGTKLHYPTDVSNVASVHLAEKAGYHIKGYMFWITIPPISNDQLPPSLQE